MMELVRTGVISELMASGATVRTAFCGPCFGAGDVPANGALSIRHTTRNFPSREGSKPGNGQLAGVALMDARSIAATTANGGILTPATDIDYDPTVPQHQGLAGDRTAGQQPAAEGGVLHHRPCYDHRRADPLR